MVILIVAVLALGIGAGLFFGTRLAGSVPSPLPVVVADPSLQIRFLPFPYLSMFM